MNGCNETVTDLPNYHEKIVIATNDVPQPNYAKRSLTSQHSSKVVQVTVDAMKRVRFHFNTDNVDIRIFQKNTGNAEVFETKNIFQLKPLTKEAFFLS